MSDDMLTDGTSIRLLKDEDYEAVVNAYRTQGRRQALRDVLGLIKKKMFCRKVAGNHRLFHLLNADLFYDEVRVILEK